jgi:hypothetical protein
VLIYALATATATAVAVSRPLNASLLPEVVVTPDDLTAANVASGMGESAGSLLGPLGAGLLVGIGGPTAVFAVAAVGNLVGAALVARLGLGGGRVAPEGVPIGAIVEPVDRDEVRPSIRARLSEAAGGVTAILADRRLRSVVAIASCATFLVGALDIFYAVLAIDLLGLGDSGVGFLGALAGLGGMAGAAAALFLVGRERLGGARSSSAARLPRSGWRRHPSPRDCCSWPPAPAAA